MVTLGNELFLGVYIVSTLSMGLSLVGGMATGSLASCRKQLSSLPPSILNVNTSRVLTDP